MIFRILAIAQKELFHIWRDPFTLVMALVMPIVLVFIFGLAVDLDVKNISIAIDDRDQTESSRRIISIFEQSHAFDIRLKGHYTDPEQIIRSEQVKAVLTIPHGWEKNIQRDTTLKHQSLSFVVDGSDNVIVGPAMNYIIGIQGKIYSEILKKSASPIQIDTRYLYNGELKSPFFIVPGLVAVVLALVSILLTSLTIAREWENGSMELLLTTPLHPLELVLGKSFPYSLIGMIAMALVYLVARLGFDVPFRGSHLVFIISCFVFLSTYLAQGILISVIAKSQAIAMQLAMVSGFLPTMLLSGFIYSTESMPIFFQYLTAIMPARWFLQIVRTLFLKESGLYEVWTPLLYLLIINFFMVLIAVKKFKRSLE